MDICKIYYCRNSLFVSNATIIESPLVSQPIFWFYHHHRHRQPISGKWRSDTIQDNWLHRIIDAWGLPFLFLQSARTLNVKFFDQANFLLSYRAFVSRSKPDAIYVIFTVMWWDDARVFAKKKIRICIQETNSSSQGFHNICWTKQLCNSKRQIALEKQGMQRASKNRALMFSSNKEKLLRTYIKVLFMDN